MKKRSICDRLVLNEKSGEGRIIGTKVYVASTEALADECLFARLYSALPAERRLKISRLRSQDEQRRSLAAFALLQRALDQKGISDPAFSFGPYGKPYLAKHREVFFNLSHSGERAMCVLSDAEVGCDVEKVRHGQTAVAKRFFHRDECDMLEKAETEAEQNELFFRLWTLKESLIKATGDGFSLPLSSLCCEIEGNSLILKQECHGRLFLARELSVEADYRYAVCSERPTELTFEFVPLSE